VGSDSHSSERKADSKEALALDVRALTSGMKTGDEAHFRAFHDAYFFRLFRYLLVVSRGDEHAARDALQDALGRVTRYIRVFDDEDVFWCWLTAVCRSAYIDLGRRRKRYLGFLDRFQLYQQAVREAPINSRTEQVELETLLASALAGLPVEERELIREKYDLGESTRNLAASRGLSPKTIESRLARVRRKLRSVLITALRQSDET
jgi:RNA polymerase sigma factor (sigma-70 family)